MRIIKLDSNLILKYDNLKDFIRKFNKVAVAFSGGVDSTFLLYTAKEVLGDNAMAFSVFSPFTSIKDRTDIDHIIEKHNINYTEIKKDDISDMVLENNSNRCYFCKKEVFEVIKKYALENGAEVIFDGSNFDDIKDYRPGMKALDELGIVSPLKNLLFTKNEIRELSKHLGLPTWDKPAFACLASRVPYGEKITYDKLKRIEKAEEILFNKGFTQLRVRDHEGWARIEVAENEREKFFDVNLMNEISDKFQHLGFKYVSLDLAGYKTGNMNKDIV